MKDIIDHLWITKITNTGKRLSFFKKVKEDSGFEFDIFKNAIQVLSREKGILKRDFKLYTEIDPILKKVPVSTIIENPDYTKHLMFNLARLVSITKAFNKSGKQIFFIRKEFVELLKETDFPENIPIDLFKTPYQTFLIVFEDMQKIETDIGYFSIEEVLVSSKEEEDKIYFELVFIEKNQAKEEIEKAIKIKEGISFSYIVVEADKADSIEKLFEKIYREINVLYNPEFMNETERETFKDVIDNVVDIYSKIARIFINLILYLNYIKDDITDVSPIPEKLLERRRFYEKNKDLKKIEKINKQIDSFTKLYIVGNKASQYYKSETEKAGNPKKPHWRRGHIRYLKHPKFKKKWTFVRPTLVGKGKNKNNQERIYKI